MGEHHANPRPGFDYWASFKGQGDYVNPTINKNGDMIEHVNSVYVTDVLTEYAMDFLDHRNPDQPFFMYLSHKAVHSDFAPAPRHRNMYKKEAINYPPWMYPPDDPKSIVHADQYNYADLPDWVKKQRYSWHGVDYMYHGQIKFDDFYRRYCETLRALDESIEAVINPTIISLSIRDILFSIRCRKHCKKSASIKLRLLFFYRIWRQTRME
jgi:hypothetical protein